MSHPIPDEDEAARLIVGGVTFKFHGLNTAALRREVMRLYYLQPPHETHPLGVASGAVRDSIAPYDEFKKVVANVGRRYKNIEIIMTPGASLERGIVGPKMDGAFSGEAPGDPDTWRVVIDSTAVFLTKVDLPDDFPHYTVVPNVAQLIFHEVKHGELGGEKEADEEQKMARATDEFSPLLERYGDTGHFEPVQVRPTFGLGPDEQHLWPRFSDGTKVEAGATSLADVPDYPSSYASRC